MLERIFTTEARQQSWRAARSTLAALALAAPVAAVAQENRSTLPPGQARVLVAKYADCVVRSRSAQMELEAALKAWIPGGDERRLPGSDVCAENVSYATTELTFSLAAYRYAMAEALYTVRYGAHQPASYDAVPLMPPPEVREPANSTPRALAVYNEAAAERYRLIIGDCVVRTAPPATHALLTSAVETNAEIAALAGIQPVLAQCLPAGQKARFNRSSLRGVLAIAALRLNAATQSAGGTH